MLSYMGRGAQHGARAKVLGVVAVACVAAIASACGDAQPTVPSADASVAPEPDAGMDSGVYLEMDGGLDASTDLDHLDATGPELDATGPELDAADPELDATLPDAEADAAAPELPPTFTEVYAILSEKCAFCHIEAPPAGETPPEGDLYPKIGFALGRLDLSSRALAYQNLVGPSGLGVVADGIHCGPDESPQGYTRVVPGDTATSLILSKLSPNPVCGVRMPDNLPELPDEEIATIAAWIAGGALNN